MWELTGTGAELLAGDHAQHVELDAWYDGEITSEGLEVQEFSWTSTLEDDAVRSSIDCTVIDADGTLLSSDPTSPLAPYGQLLSVTGIVASLPSADLLEPIPCGMFRVETAEADYEWARHRASGRLYPTGGLVMVSALDCLADLVAAEFTGPTAPQGTVQQAMEELCDGYVGVDVSMLPTSRVPESVTYEDSKWEAVKALAALADLIPVPTRDGSLTFLSPLPSTPVWDVTVDAGTLINATLEHDRDGLVNAIWATGEEDYDGTTPIRALAEETDGPFRTSGPMGMQLERMQNTFWTTPAQARAGARAELSKSIRERSVRVPFTSTWNPALDVLDTINLTHDPCQPPVPGLVVSLTVDVIAAQMTGECVVPRGLL